MGPMYRSFYLRYTLVVLLQHILDPTNLAICGEAIELLDCGSPEVERRVFICEFLEVETASLQVLHRFYSNRSSVTFLCRPSVSK